MVGSLVRRRDEVSGTDAQEIGWHHPGPGWPVGRGNSTGEQHSPAKQIEFCPAVHLPLAELGPAHLAFHLPGIPEFLSLFDYGDE